MITFSPRERVSLAPMTTLGVGGPARWFATAATAADVQASHEWCRERGVSMWVLGGGSNVVVADAGFDGLVVQVAITGWNATLHGDELLVDVGAGDSWDAVVARLVAEGWAGTECLSGIPGTVGGTPIQNVGAYGQEVASIVDAVQVLDRESGDLVSLAGRRLWVRVSVQPLQGRRRRALRHLRCAVPRAARRTHADISGRAVVAPDAWCRGAGARRRARGCAGHSAIEGDGGRWCRSRCPQRRIVLHEPRGSCRRTGPRGTAGGSAGTRPGGRRRVGARARGVVDRTCRMDPGGWRPAPWASRPNTRSPSSIGAAPRPPTWCASPRGSSAASSIGWASGCSPSPSSWVSMLRRTLPI